MKKNNELIYILFVVIFLGYLLFNTSNLNNYVLSATKLWFYKVFPFLFIMIIINSLLINNNLIYYINKIFKKNGIKYYVLIMCMLSGSPTSAYIIKKLYNNKIIDLESANKMLMYTYFSNPIFLISMLSFLFIKKIAIILIIMHYIPNIIMCLILKIKTNSDIKKIEKESFNNILNNAINTSLIVLGTLTFYIIISNTIIDILNISSINSIILKGILEITQGLNEIPKLFINNNLKILLSSFFINFGGLSIHSQIKSIISDTSINYKYFLMGRIYQVLVTLVAVLIGTLIYSYSLVLLSTHLITI